MAEARALGLVPRNDVLLRISAYTIRVTPR